ncbi:MAG: cytidylate kinase [Promethearchaeota archaeon]|nr:MAG: cytidylate kinase [Candidatus Lokiarchaeota archaeon]
MIITISGLHGTGKSTVGKILSKELGLNYYSTGQAFRDLAQEKNMSLEQFTDYVEENPKIDMELDQKIIDIAKQGDVVIDSRLSGYLLKELADFKILLTCPIETRIKRMADRDDSSFEEKLKETVIREKSELERFKKLYNINLENSEKNRQLYDLIINTEKISARQVTKKILSAIHSKFR